MMTLCSTCVFLVFSVGESAVPGLQLCRPLQVVTSFVLSYSHSKVIITSYIFICSNTVFSIEHNLI